MNQKNVPIATHPGKFILRHLKLLGVNQAWLADRAGVSRKLVSQVISGDALISPSFAASLEKVFGGSAGFWINLSANYEASVQAKALRDQAAVETKKYYCKNLNAAYGELASFGYIEKTKIREEKIINLWKFFAINSLDQLSATQGIAFRRGDNPGNEYSIAAWLQCGELEYRKINRGLPEFDVGRLRTSIEKIRVLAYEMPNNFFKETQKILAESGVALIAMNYFKGTNINGATRWIGNHPVIELSDRGKQDDKVWFTLFHEIGHVLLHRKKGQFINFENNTHDEREEAANNFANNALIPRNLYNKFVANLDTSSEEAIFKGITEFADANRISKSIIAGRLKHDRVINYSICPHIHKKIRITQ